MHTPTLARLRLPILALFAFVAISALGACAGQSTSPLATPSSDSASLTPGQRSNSGYVVAESPVRIDTTTTLKKGRP